MRGRGRAVESCGECRNRKPALTVAVARPYKKVGKSPPTNPKAAAMTATSLLIHAGFVTGLLLALGTAFAVS